MPEAERQPRVGPSDELLEEGEALARLVYPTGRRDASPIPASQEAQPAERPVQPRAKEAPRP